MNESIEQDSAKTDEEKSAGKSDKTRISEQQRTVESERQKTEKTKFSSGTKSSRQHAGTENPTQQRNSVVTPNEAGSPWVRLLYMLLFALILSLVETIVYLTAFTALLFHLFSKSIPEELLAFGRGLGRYAGQVINFLSYNTEKHPFPFNSWPSDSAETQ